MNPEDLIYSRAPCRVDLAGTGTDLSPYREEHGAQVLSVALRLYSHAMLRPRQDQGIRIRRLNDGAELSWKQSHGLPAEGPLASIQALINRMGLDRGFDLTLSTEIPMNSGLAAEASMGVAALAILEEFAGRLVQQEELAQLYDRVERVDRGKPLTQHEAYACAFGSITHLDLDGSAAVRRQFLVKESVRLTFEANCVLVSTGESMYSTPAAYEQFFTALCAKGSDIRDVQHRLKSIAQSTRDALAAGDLRSFATFLDEEWQAYQEIDPSPISERTQEIIRLGHEAGARGGKVCSLCGDCLLFYSDDLEIRHRILTTMQNAGGTILPFLLDEFGVTVWRQPQTDS